MSAVVGGTTTNFAYNSSGQLCDAEVLVAASCSAGNITYDTAGRIKTHRGWTLRYDSEGRLTSACKAADCTLPAIDKVTFTYDAEGHRTKIVATPSAGASVTREFRYHGDAIVQEVVSGTVTRDYIVDDSGAVIKMAIPAGQPDPGTYIVSWTGHGDARALWRATTAH